MQQKAKEFNQLDFLKSIRKRNNQMTHLTHAITLQTENKPQIRSENNNNLSGLSM